VIRSRSRTRLAGNRQQGGSPLLFHTAFKHDAAKVELIDHDLPYLPYTALVRRRLVEKCGRSSDRESFSARCVGGARDTCAS